jgi:hypothetical protein
MQILHILHKGFEHPQILVQGPETNLLLTQVDVNGKNKVKSQFMEHEKIFANPYI